MGFSPAAVVTADPEKFLPRGRSLRARFQFFGSHPRQKAALPNRYKVKNKKRRNLLKTQEGNLAKSLQN
jgi:hypothetical protein